VTAPSTAADRGLARAERRAVVDVLGAAVLFAACNVAWRYGTGSTLVVVFVRALLGAGLAFGIGRRRGLPSWRQAFRTRASLLAVGSGGLGMVLAGTMFRSLDGPVAGLALACTPAVALLVRDRVGGLAGMAALGSSLAAAVGIVAAASGSDTAARLGFGAVVLAVAFVAVDVVSMRSAQLAVEGGTDATAIVTGTMIVATVGTAPFAVLAEAGSANSILISAFLAAVVVALLGTVGRVLRTEALPSAGVPAVAASSQVTALGTAVGGVVLLGDGLSVLGVICAVLAAGLGALAVVSATRWRLARDRSLAASLALVPDGPVRRTTSAGLAPEVEAFEAL
jgi:drug/metabolite transporter (DMT)-like permease